MTALADTDRVILKILSGTQAGVEVSLSPGDYTLGASPDDDIQFIDVSIRPAHARLRVSPGKIELAGRTGALRTALGVAFAPDGVWQDVEPLDVVTAGTTRFALGWPNSQWATITDEAGVTVPAHPSDRSVWSADVSARRLRGLAAPLLALILLVGLVAWLVAGGGLTQLGGRTEGGPDELAATRAALDQFAFGRGVEVKQDVDGVVYVKGYVDTPVERRALTAAVEKTGVPARIRIWVLQNIRGEVENLIASQKLPITFSVSAGGELTLDGLILSQDRVARLVELIKDRVLGLTDVRSRIRTSATLLADVEKLAASTQVLPYVLMRVDGDLIEATGAIPAQRVDSWVGFLQSYARRFAPEIPLRSFVQLQGEGGRSGSPAEYAIVLGGQPSGNDLALDVARLNQGAYKLGDIFPDARAGPGGSFAALAPGGGPRAPGALVDLLREPPPDQDKSTRRTLAGTRPARDRPAPDGAAGAAPSPDGERVPAGAEDSTGTSAGNPIRSAPGLGEAARASVGAADPSAIPGAGDAAQPAGRTAEAGRAGSARASDPGRPLPGPGDPSASAAGDTAPRAGRLPQLGRPGAAHASEGNGPRPPIPEPLHATTASADLVAGTVPTPLSGELIDRAQRLVQLWRDGRLGTGPKAGALDGALKTLRSSDRAAGPDDAIPSWYLPLLKAGNDAPDPAGCWPGSQLRPRDALAGLFWLDLLSTSEAESLTTFTRDQQLLLLEVALNPEGAADCTKRSRETAKAASHSIYLREIVRNPSFVRFITRDLPPFSLDVAGVDLGASRFVVTRAGRKMAEGSAPNQASRIALIGELGLGVQLKSGLAAVLFEPDLSWRVLP